MNDTRSEESSNNFNSMNNMKTLILLLEKAEQILSIINLSDGIVRKYNQLKEMTFEKLGLEFKPLIKKCSTNTNEENRSTNTSYSATKIQSVTNTQNNNNDLNILYEILNRTRNLNQRKNLVIEFLFDLIDKFKFENNSHFLRQIINDSGNIFESQLDKIYTNKIQMNFTKNFDDLEFEIKMEEIKIKEYLNKSEISYKKFINKFNQGSNTGIASNYSHYNSQHNVEEIVNEYERKLNDLRRSHEQEIIEYNHRFNEMRVKFNPDLENDFYQLKENFENLRIIIDKVDELVSPTYEKYYQKNASWYESQKEDFKNRELDRINFLICLVNKFFVDNKYLIDLVSSLQKDKISLIEERNLPYVINAIQNNQLLGEIYEEAKVYENQSDNFHRNFEQVIDFINKNFENI
jgi:hypothetical protein